MKDRPKTFIDELADHADQSRKKRAERDKNDPYNVWAESKKPEDLFRVVEHHRPTIDQAARAILGQPSPLAQRRALLMAAEAVQQYDPKRGVPLKHYIQSQLSPLSRYGKSVSDAIPVPERLRRESAILHQAREELWAGLDREPTDEELADHTGFSVKQQRRLQQRSHRVVSEGQLQAEAERSGDDDQLDFLPGVSRPDVRQEMTDYVYHDLDPTDKLIFQHRTGYGGKPILTNNEVARRLRLSAGAVSQRAGRIEKQIQELMDA